MPRACLPFHLQETPSCLSSNLLPSSWRAAEISLCETDVEPPWKVHSLGQMQRNVPVQEDDQGVNPPVAGGKPNCMRFMFNHLFRKGILLWIIPLTETLSFTVYMVRETGIFLNLKNLIYNMWFLKFTCKAISQCREHNVCCVLRSVLQFCFWVSVLFKVLSRQSIT